LNKPIVFLLIFWACAFGSNAQRIYVSSEYDIWRLNPDDCSYSFVIHLNRGLDDMAFDTAGIFYGISGDKLLKINPINGTYTTTTIFPEGCNAMTISAQNIVYVGSPNGELYSYDLNTGVQTDLGNMGLWCCRDFTFYKR
jgi:outer membrane protein assembly factor BamB